MLLITTTMNIPKKQKKYNHEDEEENFQRQDWHGATSLAGFNKESEATTSTKKKQPGPTCRALIWK